MYPTPKADQLVEMDKQLAEAVKWRLTLLAVQDELTRELAAMPVRSREASHPIRLATMKEALLQVRDGIAPMDGVSHPMLSALVGKPGLAQTELQIVRLERECAELRQHVTRWPTPETTRPYRYTGKPYKATVDGKELMPGDVVALTETRATANADRFEPV